MAASVDSSTTDGESISDILAKPRKTTDDFERIIHHWNEDLLRNEEYLLRYAQQLNHRQDMLNQNTQSFVQAQDLVDNLERNLQQFQFSIDNLTKYNDDLEKNIGQLNNESKRFLPSCVGNVKIEQDRSMTYDLMESIDARLKELERNMAGLNNTLQLNTDHSIVKTTEDLQTCFHDIEQIQQTIEQIKLDN